MKLSELYAATRDSHDPTGERGRLIQDAVRKAGGIAAVPAGPDAVTVLVLAGDVASYIARVVPLDPDVDAPGSGKGTDD